MSAKPKTLIIVGNVAAGKSTATKLLSKRLGAECIYADNLFQTTDPFAPTYLKNTPRWAFANELWLTLERSEMIHNHFAQKHKKTTIIDSGLLMSWVYTYSHFAVGNITKEEWKLYQRLYDKLADGILEHMVVVMLLYPYKTLFERMEKRGREYELKYYTKDYLAQLQKGLNALKKNLHAKKITLVEIREKEIRDFEARSEDAELLVKKVERFVRKGKSSKKNKKSVHKKQGNGVVKKVSFV